mmetsp:Transcript_155094/g.285597  ORF Transcript_155094/g.285597 Transcript_155094/m.285597 type:complete len:128 (-) Transcript_155094:28-411(-)
MRLSHKESSKTTPMLQTWCQRLALVIPTTSPLWQCDSCRLEGFTAWSGWGSAIASQVGRMKSNAGWTRVISTSEARRLPRWQSSDDWPVARARARAGPLIRGRSILHQEVSSRRGARMLEFAGNAIS